MTDRPDGCFRWVIERDGYEPVIARWDGDDWTFAEHDFDGAHAEARVFKVGVGGTLDQPPVEWEDDIPPAPRREPVGQLSDIVRETLRTRGADLAANITRNNALLSYLAKRGP